ncbi:protein TIFY 8-like isoform X2 [Gastrolobium bilobum]|uniref:protein TIFY 8-like isoform X2 n=1 Tax=Gastrolobium bilobum TaxID=150636 RepID=UPI002AB07D23|nr:protein TIFY 8-like isoform X2 [Gastrolobium bilobum]
MAVLRMAQPQHNNGNNNNNNSSNSNSVSEHLVKPVLHDFLGMKPNDNSPKTADMRLSEVSTTLSVAASSAGTRGPFSTTSDIGSEKQVGNHLEGVPFYGPRSDFSGSEMPNRLVGNKRSNSDSTFMGSSRDAFQMVPDSFQNSHMMKVLRNAAGGERSRRANDDEVLLGMQSPKPTSASQIFQPPTSSKIDANKWERSILMNVGPSMHHPPRGGQLTPFVHQIASNKIRDTNAGPSFISQPAADEGSRTGIKGLGILSSINATATATEKTSSAALLGGSRPKPPTNIIESSVPQSQHGLTSASRQMTIFYGGQAHVFDDVHPHKADVIMALAGSNGGSWSTAFSPKSAVKLVNGSNLHSGENETGIVSNVPFPQELHGRLSIIGSSSHAIGPGDRVSTLAGGHQGSILAKETRNPVQATDASSEDKRAQ